jgi:hypothetical protein
MLRVAEMATQVAAAEAHENSGRTAMEALALKRVEYLIYPIHHFLFYHKTYKTRKTMIKCSGSQPLAARKQPVGVLPST